MRQAREPFVPTLRAQWLGHRMRELRRRRGLTLQEAATYLGCDFSAVGRYERAEWPFKHRDISALLDLYQVRDPDERARLLRAVDEAWRVDVFDTELTGSIHSDTTIGLSWLEKRAELICVYASLVPPGLLQTPEFAEAAMRFYGSEPETVTKGVELRMARQRVLAGAKPTRLTTVIEETALRHAIGDPEVMRGQLERLLDAGRRSNIEVRVLPTQTPIADRVWGQFTLLRLPDPYSSVAYLENLAGRFYFESPKSKRFIDAYDRLREASLTPVDSAELIASIAKEWT